MITTIEELEALPDGSVVQTRNAGVLTKDSVGWWSCDNVVYGAEEVAQDALPATLLIPATISQEKFEELTGALNCDYWDVVEIVEEVLHGLGIEVES